MVPNHYFVTLGTCTRAHGSAMPSTVIPRDLRLKDTARDKNFPTEGLTNSIGISQGMGKCIFVSPGLATAPGLLSSHFK